MEDKPRRPHSSAIPSHPDNIDSQSIVPGSPARPARRTGAYTRTGEKPDRGKSDWLLPVLVVGVLCGIGYLFYMQLGGRTGTVIPQAAQAVDKTIAASKRAARAAKSAVETGLREPEAEKRGHNEKEGPKFAREREEQAKAAAEERKKLAARGLTPPLTRKEVDKTFRRAVKPVRACYKRHFPNLGNFHRVRVDADIDASGKVLDSSLAESDATEALQKCVGDAVKRLRFRGKREATESHQLFALLGKVQRVKK